MMKILRYTNHSIRVTSLQALEDKNIEGRYIIRVSGHKSTASVQNYARKLSSSRKRKISTILTERVTPTPQMTPTSSSANNSSDAIEISHDV